MKLTMREKEVLTGICDGLTTDQIASHLCLSKHTITTYRKILFKKFGAHNAPLLVRMAFDLGLLLPKDRNENSVDHHTSVRASEGNRWPSHEYPTTSMTTTP